LFAILSHLFPFSAFSILKYYANANQIVS
jgi:hypothetical protein